MYLEINRTIEKNRIVKKNIFYIVSCNVPITLLSQRFSVFDLFIKWDFYLQIAYKKDNNLINKVLTV